MLVVECNDDVRELFLAEIGPIFAERLAAGRAEYGAVSTIAPTREAFQEALDITFYWWLKLQEEEKYYADSANLER